MGITKVIITVPLESILTEEQLKNGGPFHLRTRLLPPGNTAPPDPAEYAKHRDSWRENVDEIPDILWKLREKHHPERGPTSALNKDEDAEWALELFKRWAAVYIAWVLNHRAGRALSLGR